MFPGRRHNGRSGDRGERFHWPGALAGLIAAGQLEIPITAVFPLAKVQDAYRRLGQGHLLGKIVLVP
jgi:NADPH:quinone reductase-like Zn-dependent oxidoreductase